MKTQMNFCRRAARGPFRARALTAMAIACGAYTCLGQATSSDDDITQLAKMTVNGVPITDSIMPTVRPVGSVLGDDENVLDIPRSVTTVDKAWMEDRQVTDTMDFGSFRRASTRPRSTACPLPRKSAGIWRRST